MTPSLGEGLDGGISTVKKPLNCRPLRKILQCEDSVIGFVTEDFSQSRDGAAAAQYA
jgi:hypothetical protein